MLLGVDSKIDAIFRVLLGFKLKFTRRFFINVDLQIKSEFKEKYLALTSLNLPLTWLVRNKSKTHHSEKLSSEDSSNKCFL